MCICVCAYSSYQNCCDCQSSIEEGVCYIDRQRHSLHGQSVFRVPQPNLQSHKNTQTKDCHQVRQQQLFKLNSDQRSPSDREKSVKKSLLCEARSQEI